MSQKLCFVLYLGLINGALALNDKEVSILKEASLKSENPVQLCNDNPDLMANEYTNFLKSDSSIGANGEQTNLLRREQLKMIFEQELFYASRIPDSSPLFAKIWSDLRKRWNDRLANEPALMQLDRDPSLGKRDQGALHGIIGQNADARGIVINYIDVKQEEARQGNKNRSVGRKIPQGIVYDLVEANLVRLSVEKIAQANNEKGKPGNNQITDLVLNYFPELLADAELKSRVDGLSKEIALQSSVFEKLEKASQDGFPMTFNGRKKIVDGALSEYFNRTPLSSSAISEVEAAFLSADVKLLGRFDKMLERGNDAGWLWQQDHLLTQAMTSAKANGRSENWAVVQVMFCHFTANFAIHQHRMSQARIGLGGSALVTGLASLLLHTSKPKANCRRALSNALMYASFGSAAANSAVDIGSAWVDAKEAENLLLIHRRNPSDVEEARSELHSALGWGAVNLALMSPLAFLSKIGQLRNAALVAQDLEKVQLLDRYRKLVLAATITGNGTLTGYQVYEGYGAAKDLIEDVK